MSDVRTLILASASPRRSLLLTGMALRFEVCPADVEELADAAAGAPALVLENARLKCATVARAHPGRCVLGADTTVELEGEVLGKPRDLTQARDMLRRLSGRTHRVHTGLCLMLDEDIAGEGVVTSEVTFKVLDDATIDAYFRRVNPLDKAGAYGIQEGRELILASLKGSLDNVIGLPSDYLEQMLRRLNLWDSLCASNNT